MKLFAQIFAGGLHVDEQRHVMAVRLPIVDRHLDADMPRDGIDVDRRVGRAADGGIDDNRVLEGFARQNVGGFQILPDDLDGAFSRFVGNLAAFAIRRRNRRAAGERHTERLGDSVHRRGRAHRVAMTYRRR